MSRFNGTYNVDGTKSGAPSYRKAGSDETVERNGGKWYFCVDYGSSCYYKQTSGGDKPPERGWERASQGEGSSPTLKYTAGAGRLSVGEKVKLSAGYRSEGDADDGPLKPGDCLAQLPCSAALLHSKTAGNCIRVVLRQLAVAEHVCVFQVTLVRLLRTMAVVSRSG